MGEHQIRIEDTSPDFPLSRANDQLLRPLIHATGIRGHELFRVNLCRLYMQVLTISDITTGCGNKITSRPGTGNATRYGHLATNGQNKVNQTPRTGCCGDKPWQCLFKCRFLVRFGVLSDIGFQRRYSVAGFLVLGVNACINDMNLTNHYPQVPSRSSRAAGMKLSLGLPTLGILVAAERATVERFISPR
jgi:hypothetical protein